MYIHVGEGSSSGGVVLSSGDGPGDGGEGEGEGEEEEEEEYYSDEEFDEGSEKCVCIRTYIRRYMLLYVCTCKCMCMHKIFSYNYMHISVSRSQVYSITSAGGSSLSSDNFQCHPDRNLISNQNAVYFELFILCFCTYVLV